MKYLLSILALFLAISGFSAVNSDTNVPATSLTRVTSLQDTDLFLVVIRVGSTNAASRGIIASDVRNYTGSGGAGGAATNAIALVRKNGSLLANGATSLDLLIGSGLALNGTNTSGAVVFQYLIDWLQTASQTNLTAESNVLRTLANAKIAMSDGGGANSQLTNSVAWGSNQWAKLRVPYWDISTLGNHPRLYGYSNDPIMELRYSGVQPNGFNEGPDNNVIYFGPKDAFSFSAGDLNTTLGTERITLTFHNDSYVWRFRSTNLVIDPFNSGTDQFRILGYDQSVLSSAVKKIYFGDSTVSNLQYGLEFYFNDVPILSNLAGATNSLNSRVNARIAINGGGGTNNFFTNETLYGRSAIADQWWYFQDANNDLIFSNANTGVTLKLNWSDGYNYSQFHGLGTGTNEGAWLIGGALRVAGASTLTGNSVFGGTITGNGSGLTNLIHSANVSAGANINVTLSQNPDGSTNYLVASTASGTNTLFQTNSANVGAGGTLNIVPGANTSVTGMISGANITLAVSASGSDASNHVTEAFGNITVSNAIYRSWTHAGTTTNLLLDWAGPHLVIWNPSNTAAVVFSNTPSAGALGDEITLVVQNTNASGALLTWPSTIDPRSNAPAFVFGITNSYKIRFTGTNFYVLAEQDLTTGVGPYVLQTNATLQAATLNGTTTAVNINNSGLLASGGIIVTNGETNLTLTASTIVISDSNKKISSQANGTGALTNNGTGTLGYMGFGQIAPNDLNAITNANQGWGTFTLVSGNQITVTATNRPASIATNATSATVDFSDAANLNIYNTWFHLTTNLVISPTNLIVGRTLTVWFPTNSLTFDVTVTNTAATPIRWNFNVATNGSTSFTKTNTMNGQLFLTAQTNGVISADFGYYR